MKSFKQLRFILINNNIKMIIFFFFILNLNTSHLSNAFAGSFDLLQQRLIEDGFDCEKIIKLYSNSESCFNPSDIAKYFVHNESKLNYAQFTNKNSIKKARMYIERNYNELNDAEKKYGVDKKVITAILLVESRLGQYIGKHKVFNTLSTMAALIEENNRILVWKFIPPNMGISRKIFELKADKKSKWAYDELKFFLQYTQKEEIDPLCINGSYAGAIGISQFIPSSLILLGKDGNNDGKINLFEDVDAIHSVANYLKHYGWHENIDDLESERILYYYNNSVHYTNTIIEIIKLLKESI